MIFEIYGELQTIDFFLFEFIQLDFLPAFFKIYPQWIQLAARNLANVPWKGTMFIGNLIFQP